MVSGSVLLANEASVARKSCFRMTERGRPSKGIIPRPLGRNARPLARGAGLALRYNTIYYTYFVFHDFFRVVLTCYGKG